MAMVSQVSEYPYGSIFGVSLGGYSRAHGGGPSLRMAFPINDEIVEARIVLRNASSGYIRKVRGDATIGSAIRAIGRFYIDSSDNVFFELVAYSTFAKDTKFSKDRLFRPATLSDLEYLI